jgi:geranylgeranyl reductase family protein
VATTNQTDVDLQCDVLVVGAGPGGSTAAFELARSGADVLLVDKAHFPREKPCGDGLTPHAVDLLTSMGLTSVLERGRAFDGVRAFGPDGDATWIDLSADGGPARTGLVVPRHDLDDALRQRAVAMGASFCPGFTVQAPCWRGERLVGLRGRRDGHPFAVAARLVIVATGASRSLLRALELWPSDRLRALAMRSYVTGLHNLGSGVEVHLDREILPGYAWVFPVSDTTANVGVGLRLVGDMTPAEGNRRLQAAFDRFLHSERLSSGQLAHRPRGFPLRTDFPAVPTSAPGVLVVGETAGLVNPLTGEGIAWAVESGKLAAEVAAEALSAGDVSAECVGRYSDRLRKQHAGFFEQAREMVARLAYPQVGEALTRYAQSSDRVREALVAAIVRRKPQEGIAALGRVLQRDGMPSLAKSLFALGAYRPLLDRCRAYMLAEVREDAPAASIAAMVGPGRGKMLRALLVFLGCETAGGDPERVVSGAAGIELVHAASLVHDDIMDRAEMRRGLPALHVTQGTSRAIVSGDYLIAKAFRLLAASRAENPPTSVVEAFIVGAESGIRACAGQFRDVGDWTEEMLTETTYNQLIADKTAGVIAGALAAGATLAGGDDALIEDLSRYGETVGRAFQIRDDLIEFEDLLADGGAGDVDRRPMLPLIYAFRHADQEGQELVWRFLDGRDVEVNALLELLQATEALGYVRSEAEMLMERALRVARRVPHIAGVLEAFARYAVLRDH